MTDSVNTANELVQTQIVRLVKPDHAFELSCGRTLAPIDVAYETCGQLNEAGDNAVLACHALTGDAHVSGFHGPNGEKPGWWNDMIGPDRWVDTNKYFVICTNLLGGCSGTTGPGSINPETGKPYGLDFPIVTIADMVRLQKMLLDFLGVRQLLAVIGGSVGGMQVLQWLVDYPDFVKAGIPIATTAHLNAQSIAFDAVGRNAIVADPNFNEGKYYDADEGPRRGLGIARMIGHITYLSEEGMRSKFGRQLRSAADYTYDFASEFSVETYLDHQGERFVERFDANTYLYVTKAADYFDLEKAYGSLEKAFEMIRSRVLIISYSSDWLFTPQQSKKMVNAMAATGKDVSYYNIESSYGHDAFLLETDTQGPIISCFLQATAHPLLDHTDCMCEARERPVLTRFEQAQRTRVDYELIESLIEPRATVLDVGCGDGELLAQLRRDKHISARGIEVQQDLILTCVCRGLSIMHHDIDEGLKAFADKSFDYVILSQTLQAVPNPKKVFTELLRVGRRVIVSFPNFAFWRSRFQLSLLGRAPVTKQLPFGWYNSPNIHFLSLKDFDHFCERLGVTIEKRIPLVKTSLSPVRFAPNLLAEQAIYVTSRP
ncbi:MAG: homoserine O-acetyltransferase [Phycisphaerae bacterium]|nr:homoserine O-acetyltransferase [Phycisphaerae bacterium]